MICTLAASDGDPILPKENFFPNVGVWQVPRSSNADGDATSAEAMQLYPKIKSPKERTTPRVGRRPPLRQHALVAATAGQFRMILIHAELCSGEVGAPFRGHLATGDWRPFGSCLRRRSASLQ